MAEGRCGRPSDKASALQAGQPDRHPSNVNRLGQRGPTELGGHRALPAPGKRRSAPDVRRRRPRRGRHRPGPGPGGRPERGQPAVIPGPHHQGQGLHRGGRRPEGWHGKPFPPDMAERAVDELGGRAPPAGPGPRAAGAASRRSAGERAVSSCRHTGDKVATRQGVRRGAGRAGRASDVVAMDGEVSNSTFRRPCRRRTRPAFEMYIAEQQLVARRSAWA